ncbi:MAG TPA: PP2C family protein-serine/threonine phosphatase [Terracidiphilus sp.]|nr:PP2C family protein-serine/threonine phosphatase [Terracidiphilus sp.]
MSGFDPWKETPRKSIVIVLLSVFLFFTTIGFANDIMSMGQQRPTRFLLGVVLYGLFAVCYAVGGVSLRNRWWMAVLPIFVVEFFVMGLLAHLFPDRPMPAMMTAAQLSSLRFRLTLDSIATIAVVSLGYTGFFSVAVKEAQRYVKTRVENAMFESEMAAARQVQQVILPATRQSFPGFAVESVYKPAREVGGDFFQIVQVENGALLLIIGDVSGKGLPAAIMVSLLIGLIRATAEVTHDPVQLLRRLHEQIVGHTADGFATALAALIAADGRVTLANAGHLSPYLDGREIELTGALPLGVSGGGQFEATNVRLDPGSRLTFLSDGVVEAQNERGELFGFDQAAAISREAASTIAEAAVRFGQADDITVVTIERLAPSLRRF